MWPWEHLAVGYLVYALITRRRNVPLTDWEILFLVIGTQFPDLVDKTLGWVVGILPGGLTIGHSLLFALPVVTVIVLVTRGTRMRFWGTAFGAGYLSHLPGDVLYPVLLGDGPAVDFLLWPLTSAEPSYSDGVLTIVQALFGKFLTHLSTPAGRLYLFFEALLLSVALLVWVRDGCPGPGVARRLFRNS